jgi:hypothetical protein
MVCCAGCQGRCQGRCQGKHFSKVIFMVALYGKYTGALTFENLCQAAKAAPQ